MGVNKAISRLEYRKRFQRSQEEKEESTISNKVAEGAGVTVNGDKKTADQHKGVMVVKVGTDEWDIYGGVD